MAGAVRAGQDVETRHPMEAAPRWAGQSDTARLDALEASAGRCAPRRRGIPNPMHVWRPPSEIRVKALGLAWRGGRLLVAEVYTDDGRLKGVRPLGGSVGFGEPAEAALVREFREELGLTVRVLGAPFVMENLYTHEGSPGHEVLFLFPVALPPSALDTQERVVFHEDCGTPCIARWCDLEELDRVGGPDLYPVGLKARLLAEGRP